MIRNTRHCVNVVFSMMRFYPFFYASPISTIDIARKAEADEKT